MTDNTSILSWVVPCDQELALSVTIGTNTYRMKKEQLIKPDSTGTVCTSLVNGWSDPAVRAYVFGTPFASIAYIAYNAFQDQTGDQIGLAPRTPERTTSQGVSKTVLIGAIVGSVLFTVLIVSAILFVLYRRRRRSGTRDGNPSVEEEVKVEPFTGGVPNSATPILSTTKRTSGWTIEHGEIGGEPSEGSVSKRQSQATDYTPTSAATPHPAGIPQTLDSTRSRSSYNTLSMRQSQFTDVSACTPISETTEVHHVAQPSPSLGHSFHQPPASSVHGVHKPQPQPDLAPDEPAPPPYQPDETNTHTASSRVKN
jgi:hypothetical protein